MPPPTLPEELLEEVFLRLPPDEPAWLVRASLASKLWLGLLTGDAFHGRYREFHGAPPMLGFFYCRPPYSDAPPEKETEPLFLSTTKFEARISSEVQGWRSLGCNALDCRHGRVVLGDKVGVPTGKLTVSDPMTAFWFDLGVPMFLVESYGATVLCAVTGCDHRSCHDGPFRVVFVGLDSDDLGDTVASVWVSSPEMSRLLIFSSACGLKYALEFIWRQIHTSTQCARSSSKTHFTSCLCTMIMMMVIVQEFSNTT